MTIDTLTKLDFHPASKGEALRRKLSSVRGLQLNGSHRGRFSQGSIKATVSLDSEDSLSLNANVGRAIGLREALAANSELPGNLRYVIGPSNFQLVADIRLGTADDFGDELRYVIAGLRSVLARRTQRWRANDQPLDKAAVQAALKTVSWEDQAIVELGDSWELRPRIEGEAVPVKLTVEGSEVRISRVVVRHYGEDGWTDAMAAQALRFNSLIKHARLASVGEQVVADARIHHALLDGDSIATATRAVAVAERRVRHVLEILATHEEIAGHYSAMFDDG